MSSFITVRFPNKCLDMIIRLQSTFYDSSNILPSVFISRTLYIYIYFFFALAVCHLGAIVSPHKYSSLGRLYQSLNQQEKSHMAHLLNHQWLLKRNCDLLEYSWLDAFIICNLSSGF